MKIVPALLLMAAAACSCSSFADDPKELKFSGKWRELRGDWDGDGREDQITLKPATNAGRDFSIGEISVVLSTGRRLTLTPLNDNRDKWYWWEAWGILTPEQVLAAAPLQGAAQQPALRPSEARFVRVAGTPMFVYATQGDCESIGPMAFIIPISKTKIMTVQLPDENWARPISINEKSGEMVALGCDLSEDDRPTIEARYGAVEYDPLLYYDWHPHQRKWVLNLKKSEAATRARLGVWNGASCTEQTVISHPPGGGPPVLIDWENLEQQLKAMEAAHPETSRGVLVGPVWTAGGC